MATSIALLSYVLAAVILGSEEQYYQQVADKSYSSDAPRTPDLGGGFVGDSSGEEEDDRTGVLNGQTTTSYTTNPDSYLVVPDIVGKMFLVIGVPINLLSLFYFITRREKGPNELMFLCLSTTDTVICIYLIGAFPAVRESIIYQSMYRIYDQICYMSTFVTCQMSVVRMIALTHPLVRINKRVIIMSLLFFVILQFLPFFVYKDYFHLDEADYPIGWNLYYFIISTLIIVIAIISSVVTVTTLRSSGKNSVTKNKRKATITIIILTVTFLIYNIPHDIMLIVYLIGRWKDGKIIFFTDAHFIDKMNLFYTQIGMQLNSITNAFIYFIRISNMRQFVAHGLRQIMKCFRHDNQQHPHTVTEANTLTTKDSRTIPNGIATSNPISIVKL